MKKIMFILSAFICFGFILLQGESKYPFSVPDVVKAISLYNKCEQLSANEKYLESKEVRIEAEAILDEIFTEGKIISSNSVCSFKKGGDEQFYLFCKNFELKNSIVFEFIDPIESILGKYQNIKRGDLFNGEIEITKDDTWGTYKYKGLSELIIYCKILSLSPITKPPQKKK
jgi:hypothetical protein